VEHGADVETAECPRGMERGAAGPRLLPVDEVTRQIPEQGDHEPRV